MLIHRYKYRGYIRLECGTKARAGRVVNLSAMLILVAGALFLAGCIIETPTPKPPPTSPEDEIAAPLPTEAVVITPTPSSLRLGDRTVKQYGEPPVFTIDSSAKYMATVRTNNGTITVELFASQAPITVNNFVFLARDGFYNEVIFHRVIPKFMIQAGDPTGTGAGGPGYQFQDEFAGNLVFDRPGILAMANTPGRPNSNGSQFFITVEPTPHLNGAHTIFGRVAEGLEIVNSISALSTNDRDRPLDPVIIQSVEIVKSGGG